MISNPKWQEKYPFKDSEEERIIIYDAKMYTSESTN